METILMGETVSTICSSVVILLYQIAFVVLGLPELVGEVLPYSILACRPSHIIDLPVKYPAYWQLIQTINHRTAPVHQVSLYDFSREYPVMKTAEWLLMDRVE